MNSNDLRKFATLTCEERVEPMLYKEKKCITTSITQQFEDIGKQVVQSQDWFNHMAAPSSMNKLTNSMHKLRRMRSEKAQMHKQMNGKLVLNSATTKRIKCVENSLRRTNTKLEKTHGYWRRLMIENAEIKDVIKGCKLSATKSDTACLQVSEREKMSEVILDLEKQMDKLQLDVSKEKEMTSEVKKMLAGIIQRREYAKFKLKGKINASSEARALLIRGELFMEAVEAGIKRKMEEVSLKMEIDFRRRKDVARKLEQQVLNVKAATERLNSTRSTISPPPSEPRKK